MKNKLKLLDEFCLEMRKVKNIDSCFTTKTDFAVWVNLGSNIGKFEAFSLGFKYEEYNDYDDKKFIHIVYKSVLSEIINT